MRCFLLFVILAAFFGSDLLAQEPSSEATFPQQAERASMPQSESGPVAVPEPSEKALRYFRSGNVLWVINTIWGLKQ